MSSMNGSYGYGGDKVPKGYSAGRLSNFSPEQQQLFQQLFSGSSGGIGSGLEHLSKLAGGDQSYFDQLEAPALRQFGAIQGNLASRFSGMGTGARRSSGFGNTTSSAAQELSESLQSQRLGLQNQAIQDLLGLGQNLLGQKPYENTLMPKQLSGWQQFFNSIGGGLGKGLGMAGSAAIF